MTYLSDLIVKNFAAIEDAHLELGPGLNIITGETGAGKSLLVGALGLIAGNRSGRNQVKPGHGKAIVQARFIVSKDDLPALAPFINHDLFNSKNHTIRIHREVNTDSKFSFCTVNGKICSLGFAQKLSKYLLQIYSQNTQVALLNTDFKFKVLDEFGGTNDQQKALQTAVNHVSTIKNELSALEVQIADLNAKREYLEFKVEDIQAAEIKDGEEEALIAELDLLNHAESIFQACMEAHQDLYTDTNCAFDQIAAAIKDLEKAPDPESIFLEQTELLNQAKVLIYEVAQSIRFYGESVQGKPKRQEQISERLTSIREILRKYGGTIQDVHKQADSAKFMLGNIESSNLRIDELRALLIQVEHQAGSLAHSVSLGRMAAAEGLNKDVTEKLQELAMDGSRFFIELTRSESEEGIPAPDGKRYVYTEKGIDHVRFLVSTTESDSLRVLDGSISGGEASRLVLAISVALSKYANSETMVFDEIDSGIGGRIGDLIGRSLWGLANKRQVLCVTHLPQVAVYADKHIRVSKKPYRGQSSTLIRSLDNAEKVLEIAEMLGDSDSAIICDAAERLLEQGRGNKLAHSALNGHPNSQQNSTTGLLIPG